LSVKAHARGLADVSRGMRASLGGLGEEIARPGGQCKTGAGGAFVRRRRRLPGEALVKLEAGVRLGDEVPVEHRLAI
jgi:hypothetical protein